MDHKLGFFDKSKTVVETPTDLYEALDEIYNFDFDPCPVDPKFDGLDVVWGKSNYVNPPYNNVGEWLTKGIEEAKKFSSISVFLIPHKPHTKYWVKTVNKYATSLFLFEERVRFKGYENTFPVALCLVVIDGKKINNKKRKTKLGFISKKVGDYSLTKIK
jgi:hypothetical protein